MKNKIIAFSLLVISATTRGMENNQTSLQKQEETPQNIPTTVRKPKKWELRTDFNEQDMRAVKSLCSHYEENEDLDHLIDALIELKKDNKRLNALIALDGESNLTKPFALYIAHALQRPYFLLTHDKLKNFDFAKLNKNETKHSVAPVIIAQNIRDKLKEMSTEVGISTLHSLLLNHLVIVTDPEIKKLPAGLKVHISKPLFTDNTYYKTVIAIGSMNNHLMKLHAICEKYIKEEDGDYSKLYSAFTKFSEKYDAHDMLELLEIVCKACAQRPIESVTDLDREEPRDYSTGKSWVVEKIWSTLIDAEINPKDVEDILQKIWIRDYEGRTIISGAIRNTIEQKTYKNLLNLKELTDAIKLYTKQYSLLGLTKK